MQAALYKWVQGQNNVPSEDVHLIVPGFCKNGNFHVQRDFADGKSVLNYPVGPNVTSRFLMRERWGGQSLRGYDSGSRDVLWRWRKGPSTKGSRRRQGDGISSKPPEEVWPWFSQLDFWPILEFGLQNCKIINSWFSKHQTYGGSNRERIQTFWGHGLFKY